MKSLAIPAAVALAFLGSSVLLAAVLGTGSHVSQDPPGATIPYLTPSGQTVITVITSDSTVTPTPVTFYLFKPSLSKGKYVVGQGPVEICYLMEPRYVYSIVLDELRPRIREIAAWKESGSYRDCWYFYLSKDDAGYLMLQIRATINDKVETRTLIATVVNPQ